MSPLTKTFVVLVTILSVLLVALVVPFVANTQDLRAQVNELEGELSTAQLQARNAQNRLDAMRSQESQRIADLRDENRQLESQIANLEQRVASLQQDLQDARTRNQQLAGSFDVLSAEASQLTQINESKTNQLADAREKLVDQQRRVIELTNRTAELESSLDTQTRQVRRFKEQYQQSRDRSAQLEARWAQVPDAAKQQITGEDGPPISTPAEPIAGNVTGVDKPSEGVTLVQVDIGENDNVRQNMRFLVHRGERYLGTLVIDRVDADQAVGRMKLQKGPVKQGDSVYAGT